MSETMNCSICGDEVLAMRGGRCKPCICRALTPVKKYNWTPDIEGALRRAYQAKRKIDCTRAIDELVRRTRWPRYVFINKAQQLDLRVTISRGWSAQERATLRELAGELPPYKIGQRLHRSPQSVKQKIFAMGLSAQVTRGYSRNELAKQMGVRHESVERWIGRNWLRIDSNDRITDDSITRFLWDHMDEYRFRNCDEQWLKVMLNPNFGKIRDPRKDAMPDYAIRRMA